jgi:hypothetical protein
VIYHPEESAVFQGIREPDERAPETMKRECQDMVVTAEKGGEELRLLSWEASRDAALPSKKM